MTISRTDPFPGLSAAGWTNEGAPLADTGGVLTTNAIMDSETAKFFRLQLIGN